MSVAPGRGAGAAAAGRLARVAIPARHRRTSRAVPRLVRQPAALRQVADEDPPQMDRPFAPGRARAPFAVKRKTTDFAVVLLAARPRRAPAQPALCRPRGRPWTPLT